MAQYVFMIINKDTGLFSCGGCAPFTNARSDNPFRGWSKFGKMWRSEGHVKSHLTMLMNNSYPRLKPNQIPPGWYVRKYTLGEEGFVECPARELAERPAKK